MESFGIENVLSGGAIGISLTGMSIVFTGLFLISIYIRFLPNFLNVLDRYIFRKNRSISETDIEKESVNRELENEEKDIASVIGLVMQLEATHRETPAEKEEKDIANVIGLVLQLEQESQLGLPN